ncbi:tRNA (adenosine(37)-N6)-dimethylallyltransferase MiaA [Candidatus Nomurabacteria bacterium RIFCSPLOWO2_01_FULL_41_21]|uniref:tRNA dimethylallyltransferase n=2 Tax=Candidatus Nomuraibacteriota TaxID=1752729 RepID=A0A1F6V159_9BACT|nr:MAG: tRNA (adenosine(37)-N6)-dimethylallyltransferase MiaA [Candidatus Nomurabacteria bacterium RIFCSPHIGHO2_01_FULL_40_20]OGI88894.1 MAG: tRNA (adenosine(37)-N6)-dimethylallyltransferase MiaA [Candidatus Nomurabacteria bacterium RIFCSPLOWO2_01_FULL_41_21]
MRKGKVIVIVGTTATGKSDLGVKIAKKLNPPSALSGGGGEIISADSRQVYKGLDIGTGKITKEEMKSVSHHLLDVINPKKKFTVFDYQKKAISAMAEIAKKGKVPIIVGGTGFYIDAVTKGVVLPKVPPNHTLRRKLVKNSAIALFLTLKKIDPARAKNIDPHNKIRLIRAIEIAKALGKVPHLAVKPPSYRFIKIGLVLPPDVLKKKVEKRVKKMFTDGLLDEIKKLKRSGVSEKRLREFGFEYNNPTPESVITNTLKYAKRQATWFKRDPEIKWFTPSGAEGFGRKDYKKIISFLEKEVSKKPKLHQ